MNNKGNVQKVIIKTGNGIINEITAIVLIYIYIREVKKSITIRTSSLK